MAEEMIVWQGKTNKHRNENIRKKKKVRMMRSDKVVIVLLD